VEFLSDLDTNVWLQQALYLLDPAEHLIIATRMAETGDTYAQAAAFVRSSRAEGAVYHFGYGWVWPNDGET
jgi:hypothetical protein